MSSNVYVIPFACTNSIRLGRDPSMLIEPTMNNIQNEKIKMEFECLHWPVKRKKK